MRSTFVPALVISSVLCILVHETWQAWVPQVGGKSYNNIIKGESFLEVPQGPTKEQLAEGPRRRVWSLGPDGTSWPGGERIVKEHEFPFVARLVNARGERFVGTLISSTMVLTLASKVQGALPVQVRLGSSKLDAADALEVTSSEAVVHTDYVKGEMVNDIAMLKLSQAVKKSKNIAPARLPTLVEMRAGERLFNFQPAEDLGWGAAGHKKNLRSVDVVILPNANCTAQRGEIIPDPIICTKVDSQYKDGPCSNKEVGAPLTLLELDNRHTVLGLLLRSDCPVKLPPVHLRLTKYIHWIQDFGGPKIVFC